MNGRMDVRIQRSTCESLTFCGVSNSIPQNPSSRAIPKYRSNSVRYSTVVRYIDLHALSLSLSRSKERDDLFSASARPKGDLGCFFREKTELVPLIVLGGRDVRSRRIERSGIEPLSISDLVRWISVRVRVLCAALNDDGFVRLLRVAPSRREPAHRVRQRSAPDDDCRVFE